MFQGFSQETIDFLWGIRFNNERTWFEAHRQTYQSCLYQPMRDLADQVYERFMDTHAELDLVHRVSRIYRDARRLHGRGPYKDHLWFTMERPREAWPGQPVYWFEAAPEGYSYGLGYWQAPPVTMAKLRARIDRDPRPLERLVRSFNRQDTFTLRGPEYKRPKGDPGKLLAPWYNKRGFSLCCDRGHDALFFSPQLADVLLEGFTALLPLYRYLMALEGDPAPGENF